MNVKRIAMLEKLIEEDPADPFLIYALALEYQVAEKEKARLLFDKLLTNYPDYLPTYYLAGNFFLEQNEVTHATEILQRGLALAKEQNNRSTMREIQGLLDGLD